MPIEIRELVIRAIAVSDDKNADSNEESQVRTAAGVQEDIVQECVRQVLKILEKQKER